MVNIVEWMTLGFEQATTFEWILFLTCSFSVLLMSILTVGVLLNHNTHDVSVSQQVKVSVLVSARNEEKDFPACIESLLNLDYPKELLQIVLVDDLSDDQTGKIIDDYARRYSHIVAVHTMNEPDNGLEAKGRGIEHGFRYCTGEWVFITDADSRVHPKWISHSLSKVTDDDGMIGGTLMVNPVGFVGKIERLSWSFVQVFNQGMAGFGVPFACVGPNMAIRKKIYDEAGGLKKANFRIAEDLALLEMVAHAGKKIRMYFSRETLVNLTPVPSFRHLISQQRRWFRGGIEQGKDYYFMLWLSFSYAVIWALYVIFGWILNPQLWLTFMIMRFASDIFYLSVQKFRLKLKKHIRQVFLTELYTPIFFMFFIPSFLLTKKIKWMGENYSIDFN